ncbi:hypothetical protein IWT5_01503 [Secundilactobacillus silagincola]|uniref:Extracellular protein n=1 Tax=Secundilactobacillus silagincola TaxID=1714681 RepID=A0A1Z5J379_9LACO|nr:hypothetical protein [Secundilactobacillus silagincola]GAX08349.1 hypothetical protein IWT5_01503 [Secundilactobacillus silagincola]
MKKPFKLLIAAVFLICGAAGLMFTQSQPTAASSRKTSALQQTSQASISTRRVILTPAHQLHLVITAYDQNQAISHHTYTYRLYRNGKSVDTVSFSSGHTTRAVKAKPGYYSLRVYDGQQRVNFSGGLSTSDQPHFV